MEADIDEQTAETEHIEQNGFGIVHLTTEIEIDDGESRTDAGPNTPKMVPIETHIPKVEDKNNASECHQQRYDGAKITYAR